MADERTTLPPLIEPITLTGLDEGGTDDLHVGADLDAVRFAGLALPSVDLTSATVVGCSFDRLSTGELELDGATLVDSRLRHGDVPVLRAPRGTWRAVRVEESRVGSAELYEVRWQSVHLVRCKLGFLNFRGADLRDVAFASCTIEELDLVQARLQRVSFEDTTVGRLDVQHSELQHVDLRGAEIDELAGVTSLRGATVSPAQLDRLAPHLAAALGIIVEEDRPSGAHRR